MSVNITTINQLIEEFKLFSEAHFQLKDFGYGPTSDIGVSRQMDFPYLWITHRTPSTITVGNRIQIPDMVLTFIIVDQINNQDNYLDINGVNSDNQQEILSDTFQIVQDLINYISQNLGSRGIQLVDNAVNIEPTFDDTDDRVTGWVIDLTLKLKHLNCITPMADVVYPSGTTATYITPSPYLTCDTVGDCPVIQAKNTRLYTQTSDSTTITNTTTETSLIGTGLGTLSIPANGFQIGDSFRVVMGGRLSNNNNQDLTLRVKSGSVILADSGLQSLTTHNDDAFKIEIDFTIRNIGTTGVADIITLGTLQTIKKNSSNVLGFEFTDGNNTTFDTTVPNTLDITLEWDNAITANSIYSQLFVLQKTY